jgi:hypothetical protein
MVGVLESDNAVRKDAFSNDFSQSDFVDFVLMSLLSALVQQKASCAVVIEIIRRTIY